MVTQTRMKDRGALFLVQLLLSKPQWMGGISAGGSKQGRDRRAGRIVGAAEESGVT